MCSRCGGGDGTSLVSDAPVGTLTFLHLPDELAATRSKRHTDPEECRTGRAAYDAYTELSLRCGLEGPGWPKSGGAHVVTLRCSGREAHGLGRIYRVSAGWLLLMRQDYRRPSRRFGEQVLLTISYDAVLPMMLTDNALASFRCDCSTIELSAEQREQLVVVAAGHRAARPRSIRLPLHSAARVTVDNSTPLM